MTPDKVSDEATRKKIYIAKENIYFASRAAPCHVTRSLSREFLTSKVHEDDRARENLHE